MEETPMAPAPAPTGESEQISTNPAQSPAPAEAPDMHGFTSDELANIRTFLDANGGFDKVKSRISNPTQVQPQMQESAQPQSVATQSQPQFQPQQPQYRPPEGSITAEEFLAEQYFKSLSGEEKYAGISDQIRNGDVLKEMASFNIRALNRDGSINDQMVRRYLDLKAQTVPAKPTETEPNASNAPTVTYTEVGDNITSLEQAYKVIMEPGNPGAAKAEEFIRNHLNPNSNPAKK